MKKRHSKLVFTVAALGACTILGGCFAEKPVRYQPLTRAKPVEKKPVATPLAVAATPVDESEMVAAADAAADAKPATPAASLSRQTARDWLQANEAALLKLLPKEDAPALTTMRLCNVTTPIDMAQHFDVDPEKLHKLLHNYSGIMHTAQAAGRNDALNAPAPPWPGFEDVWIPMAHDPNGLELSCRVGYAMKGDKPADADCIVLLPGIFGDNAVGRTREIAIALRDSGHHVCAVELRGCGQTEARFPDHTMTFGTLEAGDLLAVADWLEQKPHVRDTGMISFCWGSNTALITAWEDGRKRDDPLVTPALASQLRPHNGRRHFEAGILLFSAVFPFEEVCDECEEEWTLVENPILNSLQNEITERMARKGFPTPDGDLRRLIDIEGTRALGYADGVRDGYDYLRLFPYQYRPFRNKLEDIRVPTLIVHAANDPLTDSQPLADLIAKTKNKNVAALILPGGGHVGFGPYAPDFFYSLILGFFDAENGVTGDGLRRSAVAAAAE